MWCLRFMVCVAGAARLDGLAFSGFFFNFDVNFLHNGMGNYSFVDDLLDTRKSGCEQKVFLEFLLAELKVFFYIHA